MDKTTTLGEMTRTGFLMFWMFGEPHSRWYMSPWDLEFPVWVFGLINKRIQEQTQKESHGQFLLFKRKTAEQASWKSQQL